MLITVIGLIGICIYRTLGQIVRQFPVIIRFRRRIIGLQCRQRRIYLRDLRFFSGQFGNFRFTFQFLSGKRIVAIYAFIRRGHGFAAKSHASVFCDIRIIAQHDGIIHILHMLFHGNGRFDRIGNGHARKCRTIVICPLLGIGFIDRDFLSFHGSQNDVVFTALYFMIITNHHAGRGIFYLVPCPHDRYIVQVIPCIPESGQSRIGTKSVFLSGQSISRTGKLGTHSIIGSISVAQCQNGPAAFRSHFTHEFGVPVYIGMLMPRVPLQFAKRALKKHAVQPITKSGKGMIHFIA